MADTDAMEPFRTLSPAAMRAQTLTSETPFHMPPPLMMSDVARAGPNLVLLLRWSQGTLRAAALYCS